MRFIPTRVHGMLDYASGLLLIVAPYLFGFADGTSAQYLPQVLGAGILLMSLITDYELSLTKLIPMPVHLGVDAAGGLLLAASPWLFGFADRVYWPHLILGLVEIGAGLMTRTTPDTRTSTELRA
jgi:SPW repeat